MIISYYQAKRILEKNNAGKKEIVVSLDLGISKTKLKLRNNFLVLNKKILEIRDLAKVIKSKTVCFKIENKTLTKIQLFSNKTNKFYKLYPTGINTAPTIEISGIRMHCTKDIDPWEDSKIKIKFISPFKWNVLDTCTGLGYTAILSSKYATKVYTFEKDKNVLKIAKFNPWSKSLFNNNKIVIYNKDIFKGIRRLNTKFFDRIIHDPPRYSLAENLYSEEFYKEMYRVLMDNGKVYHYTGKPGSKKRGINLKKGVSKRMENIGFRNIKNVLNGVLAKK